jgi:TPR repeat protein
MNHLSKIAFVGALSLGGPVGAGPIEDAARARHRGDAASAERILGPIADRGDVHAQYALGEIYADPGSTQDVSKAAAWFRKAADQGYAPAQAMLGGTYAMGGGVAPDPAQAAAWFGKAAKQDDVLGEAGLATCYARGLGVAQNDEKSFIWFKKAAERRFLAAQINVGLMYQSGRGVAQGQVQALMWFDLAADQIMPESVQGAALASNARDNLAAKMTPAQVEKAKALAASWLATHPTRQP